MTCKEGILCLAFRHVTLHRSDISHIHKPPLPVSIRFTKRWILFLWWNLMPKDQLLITENEKQLILRAGRAPRPDTLHLMDAEKR